MSYTTSMWTTYLNRVIKLYTEGKSIKEISEIVDSDEELVKSVIETYYRNKEDSINSERINQ